MELMTRVDEKFIFHQQKLESVLDLISSFYKIVSFDNNFIQDYKTKYLDSADRIFIINTIMADIVDTKLDLENMSIAIYLI